MVLMVFYLFLAIFNLKVITTSPPRSLLAATARISKLAFLILFISATPLVFQCSFNFPFIYTNTSLAALFSTTIALKAKLAATTLYEGFASPQPCTLRTSAASALISPLSNSITESPLEALREWAALCNLFTTLFQAAITMYRALDSFKQLFIAPTSPKGLFRYISSSPLNVLLGGFSLLPNAIALVLVQKLQQ